MNPFPKWVGIVSAIGALASGVLAIVNDPAIAAVIGAAALAKVASACGLVAAFSHSLTGTGGKPSP